jgi:phenylacetate-CoA ligase
MLGWRGRVDEVTKVRGMFVYPRQADEITARVPGVSRWQVVVTRAAHQDGLEFHVELAPGAAAEAVSAALVDAIRDVMKLRGEVRIVAAGTIPPGAKKIDDRRTWE